NYVWTVPANSTIVSGQGTTSVLVSYQNGFVAGTVSVYAANCILNSSVVSLPVGLQSQAPSDFDGDDYVGATNHCIGDTGAYAVEWAPGATAYSWSLPAHTHLISGQGSTSVLIM